MVFGGAFALMVLVGTARRVARGRRDARVLPDGVHVRRDGQHPVARRDRTRGRRTTVREGVVLTGRDGGSVDRHPGEWSDGRRMLAHIADALRSQPGR